MAERCLTAFSVPVTEKSQPSERHVILLLRKNTHCYLICQIDTGGGTAHGFNTKQISEFKYLTVQCVKISLGFVQIFLPGHAKA